MLRASARDFARLLLIALSLQLLAPLWAEAAPLRLDPNGALICVVDDGSSDAAAGGGVLPGHGAVDCVFCLPLIAGVATPPAYPVTAPPPAASVDGVIFSGFFPRPICDVTAGSAAPRAPPAV